MQFKKQVYPQKDPECIAFQNDSVITNIKEIPVIKEKDINTMYLVQSLKLFTNV